MTGTQVPRSPQPPLPITGPGPYPSCNLNSNPSHYPCARNRAAITADESGEDADPQQEDHSCQGLCCVVRVPTQAPHSALPDSERRLEGAGGSLGRAFLVQGTARAQH